MRRVLRLLRNHGLQKSVVLLQAVHGLRIGVQLRGQRLQRAGA